MSRKRTAFEFLSDNRIKYMINFSFSDESLTAILQNVTIHHSTVPYISFPYITEPQADCQSERPSFRWFIIMMIMTTETFYTIFAPDKHLLPHA